MHDDRKHTAERLAVRSLFVRMLFTAAAVVGIFFAPLSRSSAADQKTNIVLVMVDDLGWMDLHCQGNKQLHTPHIDRLATQGMRFTDAYAAAPVCSPTRAAVLTGQSPARLHLTTHIPDRDGFTPKDSPILPAKTHDQLASEHVTVAERLKQAGFFEVEVFMGNIVNFYEILSHRRKRFLYKEIEWIAPDGLPRTSVTL